MDVKYYRMQLDITQEALAFGAGIPRYRIAKWETGSCNPKALDDYLLRKFFKAKGIHIPKEATSDLAFSINPSKILVDIRLQKGFTIPEMAQNLNINLKKYKKIEAGNFQQSHEKDIQAIDKILGTNLHEMIYEKEYSTHYTSNEAYANELNEDESIYGSKHIQIPYLPAYLQGDYLKNYAVSGKEMDADLTTITMANEFEQGCFMVIEIASDSMNSKTEKAICDGDKLLIQEIEKNNWEKDDFNYREHLFVLFTIDYGIVCREILNYDMNKKLFTLHAWNNQFVDIDIAVNNIYRIFYAKKIVERKIKLL